MKKIILAVTLSLLLILSGCSSVSNRVVATSDGRVEKEHIATDRSQISITALYSMVLLAIAIPYVVLKDRVEE